MFHSLKIVPTSVNLESSGRDVKFLVAVGDEVLVILYGFIFAWACFVCCWFRVRDSGPA